MISAKFALVKVVCSNNKVDHLCLAMDDVLVFIFVDLDWGCWAHADSTGYYFVHVAMHG